MNNDIVQQEIGIHVKKKGSQYVQKHDEFLTALRSVFITARWFGIPTYGGKLALCWSVIMFSMLLALEVGAIWKLVRTLGGWSNSTDRRAKIARLSGAIFYGNAVISFILSWKLIFAWKKVSLYWARAETTTGLYFPPDTHIHRKVISVTIFVVLCACVEHIGSMISATGFNCPPAEYFERYILSSHHFLIKRKDYNLWVAISIFILSKLATILWNFQDLIIILISLGLTSRYNRLNSYVSRLVTHEKQVEDVEKFGSEIYIQTITWRRLREAYVRQATLVRMVDKELGPIVLLSNLNNFYFICLQLFLGINKESGSVINKVYYFVSLGWLIFRACSVVLAAADINVTSKRALPSLYRCPSAAHNVEVKRLQYQLSKDVVAFKGMGFVLLDRQLLLEVAEAIIKYELIVIQYDK